MREAIFWHMPVHTEQQTCYVPLVEQRKASKLPEHFADRDDSIGWYCLNSLCLRHIPGS